MWLSWLCELLSPSGVSDKSVHLLRTSDLVDKEFMEKFEGAGGRRTSERLKTVCLTQAQSLLVVSSVLGCVARLSSLD